MKPLVAIAIIMNVAGCARYKDNNIIINKLNVRDFQLTNECEALLSEVVSRRQADSRILSFYADTEWGECAILDRWIDGNGNLVCILIKEERRDQVLYICDDKEMIYLFSRMGGLIDAATDAIEKHSVTSNPAVALHFSFANRSCCVSDRAIDLAESVGENEDPSDAGVRVDFIMRYGIAGTAYYVDHLIGIFDDLCMSRGVEGENDSASQS